MDWQPVETSPEGVLVMTKVHDHKGERLVQPLRRSGRLWFVPSGDAYIYYEPTHWRLISDLEKI